MKSRSQTLTFIQLATRFFVETTCKEVGGGGRGGGGGLMLNSVRSSTHNGIPLQVMGKNYIASLNSTSKFQV